MKSFLQRKSVPVIVWAILILVLCLMPKSDLPEEQFFNIPHFDKMVHVMLFFVFYLALNYAWPNRIFQNVVICVVYGALVEALQFMIPTGRSAEWIDILADAIGATFAAVLALMALRR